MRLRDSVDHGVVAHGEHVLVAVPEERAERVGVERGLVRGDARVRVLGRRYGAPRLALVA